MSSLLFLLELSPIVWFWDGLCLTSGPRVLHAGNHIAADTPSHGLQWARVLQRKRESIHYWCRTIQLRRESVASGKAWLGNKHERWGFMRPGTRNEAWRREISLRERERRAELSNLWGKWWSLEMHQTVKPSTWHELQHYLKCLQSPRADVMCCYCYFWWIIAMQWLEPDWARYARRPVRQTRRLGAMSGLGRVRSCDEEHFILTSQFYGKFKGKHEVISSLFTAIPADNPGMKEGIWCQFTYFTTVFVTFLVHFWWCQDWVPRINICLLVVRSLFIEIKTSHKATLGMF